MMTAVDTFVVVWREKFGSAISTFGETAPSKKPLIFTLDSDDPRAFGAASLEPRELDTLLRHREPFSPVRVPTGLAEKILGWDL